MPFLTIVQPSLVPYSWNNYRTYDKFPELTSSWFLVALASTLFARFLDGPILASTWLLDDVPFFHLFCFDSYCAQCSTTHCWSSFWSMCPIFGDGISILAIGRVWFQYACTFLSLVDFIGDVIMKAPKDGTLDFMALSTCRLLDSILIATSWGILANSCAWPITLLDFICTIQGHVLHG